jgi:hypothetical protein
MKILFICGSLEPGRDGVGDYVQRLCWQINQLGHTASIVALNDRYITSPEISKKGVEGASFDILRLPNKWDDGLRFKELAKWAKTMEADWISLQYVPYSYHKLGTPLLLGRNLKRINIGKKWHVMVHEPYLAYPQKGIKNKIVQMLQIKSLRNLQKRLRPLIFHTTIPHYQKMLSRISMKANILGLFGNIGIVNSNNNDSLLLNEETHHCGIFFGAAPPPHEHQHFASQLKAFSSSQSRKLKLVFCGRLGPFGDSFVDTIGQACDRSLCELAVVGIKTAEEISQLFSNASFGISRVPARLVGKSGAAISMLEHGLPLWIPLVEAADDFKFLDFRPELCFKDLSKIADFSHQKVSIERLPLVASQLLNEFSSIHLNKRD